MAGTGTKVKVGSAWAFYGTVAGAVGEKVDLGYTQGGIVVSIETGTFEILVDQEGQTPIGESILGRRAQVTIPMAESDYEKLQKLIPDSTYASNLLEISSGVGDDLMDYADELLIESKKDSDDWIKLYKAAPTVNFQSTFSPDGVRLYPVTFKGYVPETGHAHAGVIIAFHEPS